MTTDATLILRPRRAKPFVHRHPWVFSGAVARVEGTAEKGRIVRVCAAKGDFIAYGFYNPDSQIIARLIEWDEAAVFGPEYWRTRLDQARKLREDTLRLADHTQAYRLVHSESDGMPGLIVDRYGEYLACQIHSAGFAVIRDDLFRLLLEVFKPKGIVEMSDSQVLAKEGLPPSRGTVAGEAPSGPLTLEENGIRFLVDFSRAQKTGWFLDQRDNRLAAARYAEGRRVLDMFSYTGGFGLAAALKGNASEVLCVDRSDAAIDLGREDAQLNGAANVRFSVGNARDSLQQLKRDGERFGMVVLDPPKYARSRTGLKRALQGYRTINRLAMQVLAEDGILVTCSCSQYVSSEDFVLAVNQAATEAGRQVQILERRGQPPDHPVIASCPETGYLKCLICRVV